MGTLCRDIVDFIEEMAPERLAEDWDNTGLLLGSRSSEIKSVMLCLDITEKVAAEAVKKQVNMIVSHHPLIFKGMKRILPGEGKGAAIYSLIKRDICVLSAHTNLDVAMGGVNDCLAQALRLHNLRPLKNDRELEGKEYGLGRKGTLETPLTLDDLVQHTKQSLHVNHVRVIGHVDKLIQEVGVFCGSFDDDLISIRNAGVDVLITGDIKYHTAQDAVEMGLCLIDAGHYNTEIVMLPQLKALLKERFPEIEITCSSMEADPFNYY
jgi:GTP cyclohydrolase I